MRNTPKRRPDGPQEEIYEIRIRGHLGPQWSTWFDDLTITLEESGDTLLTGPVVDQAALHGLLRKVRDLGLPLLSITRNQRRSGYTRQRATSEGA
jgi:hypothetical protein